MSYSNISAVLSQANKQFIKARVSDILSKLPFVVNLTIDERRSLSKLGTRRFAFVQKVLQHTKDNPAVFPSYFNVAEFEKDFNLYVDLLEISAVLKQLLEKVEDTRIAVGSEAFASALQSKELFESANRNEAGLDAIVAEIADFFSRSTSDDGTGEEPQTPNPSS